MFSRVEAGQQPDKKTPEVSPHLEAAGAFLAAAAIGWVAAGKYREAHPKGIPHAIVAAAIFLSGAAIGGWAAWQIESIRADERAGRQPSSTPDMTQSVQDFTGRLRSFFREKPKKPSHPQPAPVDQQKPPTAPSPEPPPKWSIEDTQPIKTPRKKQGSQPTSIDQKFPIAPIVLAGSPAIIRETPQAPLAPAEQPPPWSIEDTQPMKPVRRETPQPSTAPEAAKPKKVIPASEYASETLRNVFDRLRQKLETGRAEEDLPETEALAVLDNILKFQASELAKNGVQNASFSNLNLKFDPKARTALVTANFTGNHSMAKLENKPVSITLSNQKAGEQPTGHLLIDDISGLGWALDIAANQTLRGDKLHRHGLNAINSHLEKPATNLHLEITDHATLRLALS